MPLSASIFYTSVVVAFVLAFGIGANDVANRYWLHAPAAVQVVAALLSRTCSSVTYLLLCHLPAPLSTAEDAPFGPAALVPQLAAEL